MIRYTKNTPCNKLKVPLGAYKKANEKGLLKDFIFFTELKMFNSHGYFSENYLKRISLYLNCSENTVRNKIRKLNNLGWLSFNKDKTFNLKKYDYVWNELGLNVKKIRLIKIDSSNFMNYDLICEDGGFNLKEKIQKSEIEKNLNKQRHKLKSKKASLHSVEHINNDVTLSCLGVSNILGYKHKTSGYFIEKRLKELDLIKVKNRKKYIGKEKNISSQINFFTVGDSIYQQLPNLITIL